MRDDRAREKAIEKLVAEKLRGGATAPGPNCLDAATLAAYVERTLAPGERLSSEIHLAACVRCQEHVAALVRLSEADLPAGELAAARLPARRVPWFRWAWAAPALVAVVVSGLWYTGEFDRYLRRPQEAAFKPAAPPAPAHEAPAEAQPVRIAEGPAARAEAHKPERRKVETADRKTLAAGGPKSTSKDIASNAAGLAAAGAVTDQLAGAGGRIATPSERARLAAAGGGVASGVGSRTGELGRSEMKTKEEPEAADKAAAAPAPAKSEAEEATRPEEARKRELAESSGERPAPRGAPAPTPTAAPKSAAKVAAAKAPMRDDELAKQPAVHGLAGAGTTEGAQGFRQASVPRNWRVGRHGLIQKFDEKSGSWLTRPSGVEADLDDIAFPSRSVGWAVGQAGIILRTTDGGASWSKISSPTTEDLIRVTASSAESAQIVTRRGLKFATPDAGKTWNLLAQE